MATEMINSKVKLENLNQQLIEDCISGDQKAQFKIYKLYFRAMYNTSLRIVNDPMEAEDIMQESFLSAFERIETYSGTVSFGAWLRKIVINRSIDALRKERKVVFEDIDSFQEIEDKNPDDSASDPDAGIGMDKIMEAMRLLPNGYRVIISLYLLEGYDHDEICEVLSIPPGTSRSQFSRAKRLLIRKLKVN